MNLPSLPIRSSHGTSIILFILLKIDNVLKKLLGVSHFIGIFIGIHLSGSLSVQLGGHGVKVALVVTFVLVSRKLFALMEAWQATVLQCRSALCSDLKPFPNHDNDEHDENDDDEGRYASNNRPDAGRQGSFGSLGFGH